MSSISGFGRERREDQTRQLGSSCGRIETWPCAGCDGRRRRRADRDAGRRSGHQGRWQSGARRAPLAGALHGGWVLYSLWMQLIRKPKTARSTCVFPHTLPGARLRAGAGVQIRPGADWRCDRDRRWADLHAATAAGAIDRNLSAQRQRAVLCLGAGGRVSGR